MIQGWNTMQYLGIDPGKTGAISVIDWWEKDTRQGRATEATITTCKLDGTELDIWQWLNDNTDMLNAVATIENVHSMPQQSSQSGFTFGKNFGFLIGLLTASSIPYKFVTPQKWQKGMQCMTKGDKNVSKAAAQRLWPRIKMTHAIADSLLIAEYGRKFLWQ